jgi:hypothetical protein
LIVLRVQANAVFLNVPYDPPFEKLFLAYIAGISAFELAPHTAIEIPDSTHRLERVLSLLHSCRYSIHDLSRVQVSRTAPRTPRFNMPFELGLAVAWAQQNPERHSWFVFDSERNRVLRSISDLNGTDINIHNGKPEVVMRGLCNVFVRHSRCPDARTMLRSYRQLRASLGEVKQQSGAASAFQARVFADLCHVAAAFQL